MTCNAIITQLLLPVILNTRIYTNKHHNVFDNYSCEQTNTSKPVIANTPHKIINDHHIWYKSLYIGRKDSAI